MFGFRKNFSRKKALGEIRSLVLGDVLVLADIFELDNRVRVCVEMGAWSIESVESNEGDSFFLSHSSYAESVAGSPVLVGRLGLESDFLGLFSDIGDDAYAAISRALKCCEVEVVGSKTKGVLVDVRGRDCHVYVHMEEGSHRAVAVTIKSF